MRPADTSSEASSDASRDASRDASATLVGLGAVGLWALLALLTTWTEGVPPLLLNAMAFTVATLVGGVASMRSGRLMRAMRQPLSVWALGVGGLFGYHAMYFVALKSAPAVEASLIAYLWPLLIVLFSSLLPGESLRGRHIAGALLGLAGAVAVVLRPGEGVLGFAFEARHLPGYAAALVCAFLWSGYSVLSRLKRAVPTEAVTGFCAATAVLSAGLHLAFETTVWPPDARAWTAVALLGLGPVGGAFYLWDRGCKHGDIKLLGTASYAAPVLSTLVLIAAGRAEPRWTVAAACVLVTLGAVVAARRRAV